MSTARKDATSELDVFGSWVPFFSLSSSSSSSSLLILLPFFAFMFFCFCVCKDFAK